MTDVVHDNLPCGIEYAVLPLPRRHVVSFQIRMLAGVCSEPADKLGLARILAETIDKGTEKRSGRELSDAFDAIGASYGFSVGRETTTFTCTVLPEHFVQAVALHAEMLRTPTLPQDAFDVNVELTRQEQIALEDDAHSLADKLLGHKAYGPLLGRHALGEPETLETITRADIENHWRVHFHAGRMLVSVAGAVEPRRAADVLEAQFQGYGTSKHAGRDGFPVEFASGSFHYNKDLEQEQIGICWPGVNATDEAYPTQQVILGILSGGMSGRLFTEVREKQGLVYYVNAWHETPRGSGMLLMGASTTPERCDKTYATLLREVDRLAEDIQQEELERAVTGIVAQMETRGDSTRARCGQLASDLFFFGRPIPEEDKIADLQAVTIDRIRDYLTAHPRDRLCVVTLGPRALAEDLAGEPETVESSTT